MAVSLTSDFKIYNAEFNSGAYEALAENTQIFNGASRGAIIMTAEEHRGVYKKEAAFKIIADLVSRQDLTSTSALTPKKLEQVEEASVKLHRKIHPVDMTFNAFEEAGLETPDGSYRLGRMVSDAMAKDMANIGIISLVAAVGAQTDLIQDITAETVKTANLLSLIDTRGKWGDNMNKIGCWLSHSKPHINLIKDGLENYQMDSVAGVLFSQGIANTLAGAPFVVSDNSNLYNLGSPRTYNLLGLAGGACLVQQSQITRIVIQIVTINEQLIIRLQGEYAATVGIDGVTWDVTSGGANPTDATLGTTTNWDSIRTATVSLPFVKLLCQ